MRIIPLAYGTNIMEGENNKILNHPNYEYWDAYRNELLAFPLYKRSICLCVCVFVFFCLFWGGLFFKYIHTHPYIHIYIKYGIGWTTKHKCSWFGSQSISFHTWHAYASSCVVSWVNIFILDFIESLKMVLYIFIVFCGVSLNSIQTIAL